MFVYVISLFGYQLVTKLSVILGSIFGLDIYMWLWGGLGLVLYCLPLILSSSDKAQDHRRIDTLSVMCGAVQAHCPWIFNI